MNKLSRARVEYAKDWVKRAHIALIKELQSNPELIEKIQDRQQILITVEAALDFLLNPSVTRGMMNRAILNDPWRTTIFQEEKELEIKFNAMMAELTKDDNDDRK